MEYFFVVIYEISLAACLTRERATRMGSDWKFDSRTLLHRLFYDQSFVHELYVIRCARCRTLITYSVYSFIYIYDSCKNLLASCVNITKLYGLLRCKAFLVVIILTSQCLSRDQHPPNLEQNKNLPHLQNQIFDTFIFLIIKLILWNDKILIIKIWFWSINKLFFLIFFTNQIWCSYTWNYQWGSSKLFLLIAIKLECFDLKLETIWM